MNRINPISFIVKLVLGRANLGDATLKEEYSTVTRIGALLACFLGLLSFYGLQRFEPDIDIESEGQIIIENIEIPETQQFETPPPPARPSIPIESEDEDLADDLTIEETDLDNFDAWDAPPPPPSGPQFKFIPYDDPPRPITPIKPLYPDIAQEAGIEGQVLVQCFIDEKGRVKETIVLKGIPNTGLNESAVDALRKTRFRPAKQRERPVAVWVTIPVNFKLQN
jgi:protein TonB|tara:strand:- start:1469 stop:2140 length:672 start_codon:yes stop_codon:yes gene_type:complete